MIEVVANGRFRIFEEQQPHLSSKKRQPIGFFGFLKHHVGQITKGALALGGLVAFGALSYATRGWWRGKSHATARSSMQVAQGIVQPVENWVGKFGANNVLLTEEGYFPPRFTANLIKISQGENITLGSSMLNAEDMEKFYPGNAISDILTISDNSEVYTSLALSNNRLATGQGDGAIYVWNLNTSRRIMKLVGHTREVTILATLSEEQLVSGSCDEKVRIWDLITGSCTKILGGFLGQINLLAALSGERLAISGQWDKTLRIWDLANGSYVKAFEILKAGDENRPFVVLSGQRLALGSSAGGISIWDLNTGNRIKNLEGHSFGTLSMAVLSDGLLASGGCMGGVRIWNITSEACIKNLETQHKYVRSLIALSEEQLASTEDDNNVRIWDLVNGNCTKILKGHSDMITTLRALSERQLVSGGYDQTLRIWDLNSGNCTEVLKGKGNSPIVSRTDELAVLAGERLASINHDKTVHIWDLTTGSCIKTLEKLNNSGNIITALPGEWLTPENVDNILRIWDLVTVNYTKTLEHMECADNPVMFLEKQGRMAAIEAGNSMVNIRDITTGNVTTTLQYTRSSLISYVSPFIGDIISLTNTRIAFSVDLLDTAWNSIRSLVNIWYPTGTDDNSVTLLVLENKYGSFMLGNSSIQEFTRHQLKRGLVTFVHNGGSESPSGKIAIKIGDTIFPAVPLNFDFRRTPLPTSAIVGMGVGIPGFLALVAASSVGIYKLRKSMLVKAQAKKLESELSQRYQGYIIPAKDLEIGKILGSGSSGSAYLASWKGIDVVVKKIHTGLTANAREDFQKEASMMAQLNHPNIVRLYGVCMEKGQCGMVMEYMPEGSLDKALYDMSRKILWPKRWRMALDISLGVAYLHERIPPIVHRDLKSANIFVDENLLAKVGDFGMAKVKSVGATVATSVGGSPAYMDPESLVALSQGKNVVATPASDIYSLGVLLWEIASRQGPYSGMNLPLVAMVAMVANSGRPEIPKDTPTPYAALITRCWAQRAETRPRIGEVVQFLKAHQSDVRKPVTSTTELTTNTKPQPGVNTMFRQIIEEGRQGREETKKISAKVEEVNQNVVFGIEEQNRLGQRLTSYSMAACALYQPPSSSTQ